MGAAAAAFRARVLVVWVGGGVGGAAAAAAASCVAARSETSCAAVSAAWLDRRVRVATAVGMTGEAADGGGVGARAASCVLFGAGEGWAGAATPAACGGAGVLEGRAAACAACEVDEANGVEGAAALAAVRRGGGALGLKARPPFFLNMELIVSGRTSSQGRSGACDVCSVVVCRRRCVD